MYNIIIISHITKSAFHSYFQFCCGFHELFIVFLLQHIWCMSTVSQSVSRLFHWQIPRCRNLQQILTETGDMSIWLSWMPELLSKRNTRWQTEQHSKSRRWTSNMRHTTHQSDTARCRWCQLRGILSLYSTISKGIKQHDG